VGIELTSATWKAAILTLNYARSELELSCLICFVNLVGVSWQPCAGEKNSRGNGFKDQRWANIAI
jgi:hypothetical protein